MTRLAAIGITALLCLGLSTSLCQAKIVKRKSIAGVAINDSKKDVQKRLGKPSSTTCNHISKKECGPLFWDYSKRGLTVAFAKGKVVHVFTDSASQRTSDGIGPGVKQKHVAKLYPGCAQADYCFLHSGQKASQTLPKAGQRYTLVQFRNQRVDYVIVGRRDDKYDGCAFGCG